MHEIGTRLEGLRRQARQAIRYRKLSGEIRRAEATLYLLNWEAALARLAEAEAEFAAASATLDGAAAAQTEAAKNEAVAAHRLPEIREAAAAASAALQRARSAAEVLDREEAQLKARRHELSARRLRPLPIFSMKPRSAPMPLRPLRALTRKRTPCAARRPNRRSGSQPRVRWSKRLPWP
jgi:chromosome segregation ATPase